MKIGMRKAFTLFEMMIVLTLIGVIIAFVVPQITRYLRQAGQAEVKLKFNRIKQALLEYKQTFQVYPTTREGLHALITNPRPNVEAFKREADKWPFLDEKDITDKAGNEYVYHCPPERHKGQYRSFELIYLGPTQAEGDPEGYVDGI
jgi:general secretion pathway protein G